MQKKITHIRNYITINILTVPILWILTVAAFIGCTQTNNNTNKLAELDQKITDTILFEYQSYDIRLTTGIQHAYSRKNNNSSIFESGFEIEVPELLSKTEGANKLNLKILSEFSDKITEILKTVNIDTFHFYMLSYDAVQTDSILTILITEQHAWYLSERLTYKQVYHFDFKNNVTLQTSEMLQAWQISQVPLLNSMEQQITQPGNDLEHDYPEDWLATINDDINRLKIYRNRNSQIVIIYPWHENPTVDNERIIE